MGGILYNRTMASQNLTTGSASGVQTTTQNPQISGGSANFSGQSTGTIQRGTASELLTSSGGVSLQNRGVTTLNLKTSTISNTKSATVTGQAQSSPNPFFLGFSLLLFGVAIVLFWTTSRSAKNTTK